MSVIGDWLYDASANRFRDTYTKGFIDISGGNLILRNGDISANGNLSISGDINNITTTELDYLSGTTSSIQTQLDNASFTHKTEFDVTVASKTSSHPYNGSGSVSGYYVNGYESPIIQFKVGKTYRFNQDDSSNISHPILFYNDAGKSTQYTSGVTTSGTAGSSGSYVEIQITSSTPVQLYYQCANHGYMGNYGAVEISVENVTNDELGYLNGATSNIQTQIDLKAVKTDTDVSLNLKAPLDSPNFTGSLEATGDVSFNNKLSVGGDVSFNGDLTVKGNLEVYQQQNNSVINTTVNNYEVIITNDLSLNGSLTVDGDASFNKDIYIEGNTNISGDILPLHINNSNLGSETKPFGSLYISNNTIFFEGSTDNDSGSLTFDGGDISILKKGHSADQKKKLQAIEPSGKASFTGDISSNAHLFIGGDASLNTKLFVADDVSLNSHLSLGGDASFSGHMDVCGNFYAQYPDNSIPSTSISGGILNVSTIQGDVAGTEYSNINTLRFDADSGFDVTDLSNGVVKVGMNSTFKTWKVDGQDDLVASGLDSVTFVAGNNMDISTNTTAGGEKQIIFHGSGSGSSSGGSSSGGSSTINNKNQTFYDALTQQPHQFAYDSSSNTTSSVTVNWNYDDIIGTRIGTTDRALLTLFSENQKYIPYIDTIYIDVSFGTTTNGWKNYRTWALTGTTDYNTSAYKTVTFTKNETPPSNNNSVKTVLQNVNPFDVRIYGENNASEYPDIDTRSLVIEQISFTEAAIPGAPDFNSHTTNNDSQITLSYKFDEPELGAGADTTAKLHTVKTKYRENNVLVSTHFSMGTTVSEDTESESVSRNQNFTSVLQNLRAGTKYDFISRIRNDLQANYNINDTDWNAVPNGNQGFDVTNGPTDYTQLPPNTSTATTPNGNQLVWLDNRTTITTSSLSNSNQVYINLEHNEQMNANNNNQTFQISNPSANQNSTSGFGKYLDNEHNLISITASVDNVEKQRLTFDGFYPGAGDYDGSCNSTGTSSAFFNNPSQVDQYAGNARRQGFRLNGLFSLKDIANNNIESEIGSASSTPYSVNVTFTRNTSKVGGTATTSTTTTVYVDSLLGNPYRSASNNASEVKTVVYNMGIPTVATFNIDLTRTYSNINSVYGYIRGDRKLVTFTTITNVNGSAGGTIYIAQNSIDTDTPGQYSYDESDFISSLDYSHGSAANGTLYHNTSRTSASGFNAIFTETYYSLKGSSSSSNSVTLDHYCDKNSFNGNGSTLSSKLSISSGDIMEVGSGSVSNFGSDLTALTQTSYTNHTTSVQDHTLLYLNGQFRSPSSYTYPNTNNFTWDSVSHNTYTAGSTGLNTSGSSTTSSPYKWITFRIKKVSYNSSNSVLTMSCNSTNYYVSVGSGTTDNVFDLGSLLSNNGFDTTTVNNIFDAGNSDAIAILRLTRNDGNERVGHTKRAYDGGTFNWISTTSGYNPSISLSTLISSFSSDTGYNGRYSTQNKIVLYSNFMDNNDYFYVYVGLK